MVDEDQRTAWLDAHRRLVDELGGRVRPRRSSRTWLATALVLALLVGLLVWSWSTEGFSRTERTPEWVLGLRWCALGTGAVLLVLALVLGSRRSGSLGAPRYSWAAYPGWAAEHQMVRLIRSADPADPEQVWWAADLAHRLAAQRWNVLFSAGMVLFMLSLGLGASTMAMVLLALLAMGLHLRTLVAQATWDRTARAFLRRHGQPASVTLR